MNIVCNLPGPKGAWKRAATYLGHNLEEIDQNRVLDAFNRVEPDIAFIDGKSLQLPVMQKALSSFTGNLGILYREGVNQPLPRDYDLFISDGDSAVEKGVCLKPALDALPGFQPGKVRPEFSCDMSFVGTYKSEYDKYLIPLCNTKLNIKLFGDGNFPFVNYLGQIQEKDVMDVYASSKISLNLDNDPYRALSIMAAGGTCMNASRAKYFDSGVLKNPLNIEDSKIIEKISIFRLGLDKTWWVPYCMGKCDVDWKNEMFIDRLSLLLSNNA